MAVPAPLISTMPDDIITGTRTRRNAAQHVDRVGQQRAPAVGQIDGKEIAAAAKKLRR
jgi:hypothetical protein